VQPLSSPSAFLGSSPADPCARETVLNAIRESRKRAVEEEEEDQASGDEQESKRKRHDSSGSGQSAFEPLVANGAPTSLIPKPGSLKRGLVSHCPDDCSNKRSRTSSMSSLNNTYASGIPSSTRNAILQRRPLPGYKEPGGRLLPEQLWKRSGVSMSPPSSPASSRPQTPEWPLKRAREEEFHRSNASTPVKSDKELQTEKVVETPVQKKQNSLSPPSALGSSGKRKRKIPLLTSQPGDQLTLPPPPQLGYSITSEDLDAEKKAMLQWFNKVLEDKTAAAVPTTTAAVTTTTPVFKPIFGTLPKSESAAPCTAVVSTTVTMSASSGPSSTSSTTTMFKPIFVSVTTASSPVKVSPFAFKPTSHYNSHYTKKADATIKPVFRFGLNPPTSTGPAASPTVTAATSTSTMQPFLFGTPATSAPSMETSFASPGPVFQFGKPPPGTVTATTSVPGGPAFGQAPSNSTAPTTTVSFSIFGGTTLTSSTPATTGQAMLTFGSSGSAFGSSFSTRTNFSAGQSGAAPAATPFGSSLTQSALGAQNQSTPFAFSTPSNPMFGGQALPPWPTPADSGALFPGTPAPTFGQSTPMPGAVGSGSSSLSFGTPSTAASGFGAVEACSSTPAFSIGAGSKTGARQRLQA
ncbi:PREDICTED: nuclear envelope pore membrane protein POM 121-like, partial [Pterocles gutturalis]|uniref:nuclear envelope pore membrane protein POM 121-like n=1 Tax=Pterocles gutturalis TaxID=240206 RepID=UPI00052902C9